MIIFDPLHTIIDYGPDPVRPPPHQTITDTINYMKLPINCVVAGQQPEEKKSRIVTDFRGILKGIFDE